MFKNNLSIGNLLVVSLILSLGSGLFLGCSSGNETRGLIAVKGESPKPFQVNNLELKIFSASDVARLLDSRDVELGVDLQGLEERRRDLLEKLEEAGRKRGAKRSEILALSGRLNGARANIQAESDKLAGCLNSAYDLCGVEVEAALEARIGSLQRILNSAPGQIAAAQRVLVELEQGVSVANANLNNIEKDISERIKFDTLFKDLPSPITTIKSAKDGKFVIEVPKGRYAIIAKGKNASSGLNEDFYWAFWYDASGNPGDKLELNNSNLFMTENESNVIRISKYIQL